MGEGALWKKRPFFCAPCRKTFLWRDGLLIADERRWWNDSILPHPVGSAGIAKNRQLIAKIVSFFLRVLCLYRDHSQMLTEVRHEYDHERKTACPPPLPCRWPGRRSGRPSVLPARHGPCRVTVLPIRHKKQAAAPLPAATPSRLLAGLCHRPRLSAHGRLLWRHLCQKGHDRPDPAGIRQRRDLFRYGRGLRPLYQ